MAKYKVIFEHANARRLKALKKRFAEDELHKHLANDAVVVECAAGKRHGRRRRVVESIDGAERVLICLINLKLQQRLSTSLNSKEHVQR